MDFEQILNSIIDWAATTGVKIIIALVLLIVSFRIITVITRRVEKNLIEGKRKLDKTLVNTLFYLARLLLKAVVAVCLIAYLGIDTGGITALIASVGVGVGLAVNGALSNLAGGALILITRPFKIDDFIEAQGYSGTVEDIHIVTTRLRTPDNKVVYLPNGTLSAGTIVNYSEKDIRRVEHTFAISYSNDFDVAKKIISDIAESHEKVLKTPAPFIRVSAHGESSINIVVRVWTMGTDYWDVHFDLLESVKRGFDEAGIKIPFNQLDVNIKKQE